MKKRLLLLITAMLFSTAITFAQGGTTGPLTWNISGNTLTISGTGEMPDYGFGGSPWFEYRESITTCTIETGVTSIGECAFLYCRNLTSITISDSVKSIGDFAFSSCERLISINIPNRVTSIGNYIFDGCWRLPSISIPDGVISIGNCAFRSCEELTSVILSNSLEKIESGVFTNCYSLPTIIIPNSVTSIGADAFSYCHNLFSIDIPDNVTSLGSCAFRSCTNLTAITLSNNITSIEHSVFESCIRLESVIIPNSVTSIGHWAFKNCSNLISLTLSNNLTSITGEAFSDCSSLSSIIFPSSITSIGDWAFSYCTSLTSITNLNLVPIDLLPYTFYVVNQSACTLKVPTSAVSTYENADVWKEFYIVGDGILVNTAPGNIEHGFTTGDGIYEVNATAIVTATAYTNYKFLNWTKDGIIISTNNPYSFTVTEDVELIANFESEVGVENRELVSIKIYPNPTRGELKIESGMLRIENVVIYDISGKIQKMENLKMDNTINISHLSTGIYFVKIHTEKGVIVRKILKE